MNFFKEHWFGFIISVFMAYAIVVFALVAVSPHSDTQNRGFVPCTNKMMGTLASCDGKYSCFLRNVINGNLCYAKVVNRGLVDFVSAKQPTPWSNYLFEAETISDDKDYYPSEDELSNLLKEEPEMFDINQRDASLLNSDAPGDDILPEGDIEYESEITELLTAKEPKQTSNNSTNTEGENNDKQ